MTAYINERVLTVVDTFLDTNFTTCEIEFKNVDLDTKNLTKYISVSYVPITEEQSVIRVSNPKDNAGERRQYFLQIIINTEKGKGGGENARIADALTTLLNNVTLSTANPNEKIEFGIVSSPSPIGINDKKWYSEIVRVKFWIQISNTN